MKEEQSNMTYKTTHTVHYTHTVRITHSAVHTVYTHCTTYHQVPVLYTKLLTGALYLHSSTNFPNVLQSNISIYICKYT